MIFIWDSNWYPGVKCQKSGGYASIELSLKADSNISISKIEEK